MAKERKKKEKTSRLIIKYPEFDLLGISVF